MATVLTEQSLGRSTSQCRNQLSDSSMEFLLSPSQHCFIDDGWLDVSRIPNLYSTWPDASTTPPKNRVVGHLS